MNTAQARFKEGYSKYIAEAFLATLIVHFLVFYLMPPFEFTPYRPAINQTTIIIDEHPAPIVIPEPDEVKPPVIDQIPTIDEGTGDDEIIMPKTSPRDFTDFKFTPMPKQEFEEFVAWDRMPVLIKVFSPAYPSLAIDAGIEGKVLLRVTIGSDGRVEKASVIHSDVTPAMVFEPAMQQSIPVRSLMAVPVWFRLR
jgi:hypothetical protein